MRAVSASASAVVAAAVTVTAAMTAVVVAALLAAAVHVDVDLVVGPPGAGASAVSPAVARGAAAASAAGGVRSLVPAEFARDRLERRAVVDGLVVREPDPDDARRTRIRLTDAGRDAVRAAGAGRRRAIESGLDGFTDEERAQFAELFARFAEGFRRGRER